ncbi:MAG: twin-arginine translocase subunit TatC [Bacteroidales bacterium]|nr:twin-arginine translocase subunit TatC [Bacteroidales bacterium]
MKEGTFWEHLEELRWTIIRVFIVALVLTVVIFSFKDFVFNNIIFAPCDGNFVTYRILCNLGDMLRMPKICPNIESISIININLSAQLMVHLSTAFYIALIVSFPYIVIELWLYVSPALYVNEKKPAIKGAISFVILFFTGVLLAYYLIFPLTLNFLGNYQVSDAVPNQISLNSYISTFNTLLFMMGLVFEMPVVGYFFGRIGVLQAGFLKQYRNVAVVIVLVMAALITPSTDIFTMMIVALPLMLLYELTIAVVKSVNKKSGQQINADRP